MLQIVQPMGGLPKGEVIKDDMAELFLTTEGKLAIQIQWQGLIFTKKARFVFLDDTVNARFATPEEVTYAAKKGGSSMARAGTPGGMLVQALTGLAGELSHTGEGKSGVAIQYRNPKGHPGVMIIVAEQVEITKIVEAIPQARFSNPK